MRTSSIVLAFAPAAALAQAPLYGQCMLRLLLMDGANESKY